MANLTEEETFDEGIYRIETSDPVVGGELGIANKAAKALANRTKWLKAAIENIYTKTEIDAKAADGHQEVTGNTATQGTGSLADMAGMTKTFTPKGKKIFILFSAELICIIPGQTVIVNVNYNGTVISTQTHYLNEERICLSMQKLQAVTPGVEITVKITWNTSLSVNQQGNNSPRVLSIIDLP